MSKAKNQNEFVCYLHLAGLLVISFFDREYGGDIFLRKVGFSTNCTMFFPENIEFGENLINRSIIVSCIQRDRRADVICQVATHLERIRNPDFEYIFL
jgi:hypothetical protein